MVVTQCEQKKTFSCVLPFLSSLSLGRLACFPLLALTPSVHLVFSSRKRFPTPPPTPPHPTPQKLDQSLLSVAARVKRHHRHFPRAQDLSRAPYTPQVETLTTSSVHTCSICLLPCSSYGLHCAHWLCAHHFAFLHVDRDVLTDAVVRHSGRYSIAGKSLRVSLLRVNDKWS